MPNPASGPYELTASMKVRLLPFIEQQALANSYNYQWSDYVASAVTNFAPNFTVMFTQVNVFLCPSDGNPGDNRSVTGPSGAKPTTNNNYPNNMGMEPIITGGRLNGPSWYLGGDSRMGTVLTLAGVTDGTSNTVIVSEWVKGNAGANKPGPGAIYDLAPMTGAATILNQKDVATCQAQNTIKWDYKGQFWTSQSTARGGGYWHIMTPNKKGCNTSGTNISYLDVGSLIGPSSNHPGGVNMLFLDGSVKFVKDSIGYQAYYGISTVSGGEVVSADAL